MANPARAYLATQVETTTQGELLLMLYEAAIKFLKRAKVEMANKDYAKKGIYISKAMAIIHELAESLNKEKGGDITPKLSQLYMFCTSHLTKANIRMDQKKIDDVIKILDGLRSAYAQIVPEFENRAATGDVKSFSSQATPKPEAPKLTPQPPIQHPSLAAQSMAEDTEAQEEAPSRAKETPPARTAAPQQPAPPKLRSAFNAAKFRAANAYTNNR